ncbi:hypothetical protein FEM48_Zijuj06G0158600 [Ziziphus jujuba var. spinosa]|uniref:Phosphoglycerate mutase-like protein 1 n=1 Tax=Ziziphus jujuba var. spinosa TaxID=714518 RepID=A0A978VA75_ZIZJJ|nr:hypothetical protein FEM48_Zijuj06G0158600 [Ziziphus jujuba var. spinosa]
MTITTSTTIYSTPHVPPLLNSCFVPAPIFFSISSLSLSPTPPRPPPSSQFLCFSATPSDMDTTVAQTLYPLHRCKTLHLVRHAQGIHNVEGEKNHDAYLSYDLFDAHLTPLGWKQVHNLRKHVQASGLSKRIDLVITSPLLRLDKDNTSENRACREIDSIYESYVNELKLNLQACEGGGVGMFRKVIEWTMQTAVGVFGGEAYTDGIEVTPLMVANAGNSDHSAISSLNCPPFVAVELCREHLVRRI